jgi:hypothetical protein
MSDSLPAILMLPPHGSTQVEEWVAEGRLAAASDLVFRLQSCGQFNPIIVIAEDAEDEETLTKLGALPWKREAKPFHFGKVLTACLQAHRLKRFGYFGGASAPLLQEVALNGLAERLLAANSPQAITNNLHSSDWFLTNEVDLLQSYQDRLPSDNPLGWVYAEQAGVEVLSEPPSAATRLDLDTPMDFAMLLGHPDAGPQTTQFLQSVPSHIIERVQAIREILSAKAKNLTIIGRASSQLWRQIEQQTQIWIRLIVEERGMVASQRLARGEVDSLVARIIDVLGEKGFVESLSHLSDAVIWDTRVWMAAELGWPSAGDRFASDLGRVDDIQNQALRALAIAINKADIPILVGGYGVVSGGLYALLESITEG